ncbi:MAG: hypothetical protein R2856_30125 [Caldilineaceae bacterium]
MPTTSPSEPGYKDVIPGQETTASLRAFAYVTDLLMPLYPFDTPLSNPYVFFDPPSLRWRLLHKSVDGYQVEIARDPIHRCGGDVGSV